MEHVVDFSLFFLLSEIFKVTYGVSRSAKLDKNYRSFLYSDIPVILEFVNQTPDGQSHELRVSLEELSVFLYVDLGKVVTQTAETTENVQPSSFTL